MEAVDWLGLLLQVNSQEEERGKIYSILSLSFCSCTLLFCNSDLISVCLKFCPPSPKIRVVLVHDLQLESKLRLLTPPWEWMQIITDFCGVRLRTIPQTHQVKNAETLICHHTPRLSDGLLPKKLSFQSVVRGRCLLQHFCVSSEDEHVYGNCHKYCIALVVSTETGKSCCQ